MTENHAATRPWAPDDVQLRIAGLRSGLPLRDPHALARALEAAVDRTNAQFDDGTNLYAGANALSELARSTAAIELGSRPSLGDPGRKFPHGVEYLDLLEIAAEEAVRATMRARFAEVRPHSATMANLAALCVLTETGDTIAALPERAGGHVSHRDGVPSVRDLRVVDLPYDFTNLDVDLDGLAQLLRRERPRLVVLGGNLMLRPHALAEIVATAHEGGARVLYDASHVAGLIAGGLFQDPLGDGADVLTFSTYKSFGGPAGGVICTDDAALAERLSAVVYPVLSANYDIHRLAPLAVTASEHLEAGPGYAAACITNARALGAALAESGVPVLGAQFGYTETHHLAVDVRGFGGGDAAATLLASAGIFSSEALLPRAADDVVPDGLRFGTQELTRRGLSAEGFAELGAAIGRLLHGEASVTETREHVRGLA